MFVVRLLFMLRERKERAQKKQVFLQKRAWAGVAGETGFFLLNNDKR